MRTKRILLSAVLGGVVFILCAGGRAHAQTTAFTYQGRLNNNGAAAAGRFDFQFFLFDAGTNGNRIAGPLTKAATVVTNGLFSVQLNFGPRAFTGGPRWLQIGVRTNGSTNGFFILKPRQPIAAAPGSLRPGGDATFAAEPADRLNHFAARLAPPDKRASNL